VSSIREKECGSAPANDCIKSCSDSVLPCIMDPDVPEVEIPDRHAMDDCNHAGQNRRHKAEAVTKVCEIVKAPYDKTHKDYRRPNGQKTFAGA